MEKPINIQDGVTVKERRLLNLFLTIKNKLDSTQLLGLI